MRGFLRRVRPNRTQTGVLLVGGLLLAVVFIFFIWRLESITTGLGPAEKTSAANSQNIKQIIENGANTPFYLAQHIFINAIPGGSGGVRLASVTVGVAIFLCLLGFLRSWFGKFVALMAGLIFITTPWVVLSIRTGTPDVMLLWPIVLMGLLVWATRAKQHSGLWWLLLSLVVGIGLYIPGFLWLLAATLLITRQDLARLVKKFSAVYLVSGFIIILLLAAPLIFALSLEPARIRQLLLIPSSIPPVLEILSSVGWSGLALFLQTRDAIDIGVGRLPILNFLQIALMFFGLYALSSRAKKILYSMLGLLGFSIIAAGVNHNPHLLLIGLPGVAVFMAAGLRYLFIEWRRVFPLNPFSYGLAIGLIVLVVSAHLLYTGRYSLIAWPNTVQTQNTYVLK
jgi:4-amino-4-deoxy-L-arabinose transferase-like glycosyltransferase